MTGLRLTKSQVETQRIAILAQQGGRCAICQMPIDLHKQGQDPVLDHDHTTGAVRGVLHRSCNALLGNLENNYKRWGVRNLLSFCSGLAAYLRRHATNVTGFIHPTHKTEDEKRLAKNAKARKARATKKATIAKT